MNKTIVLGMSLLVGLLLPMLSALAAESISAPNALKQSEANQLMLVDVRRPSEWQQTGVPKNAKKISMHQDGFLEKMAKQTGGDKSKPIAVICAHGIRSTHMAKFLEQNGYTNVYNIKEGMQGSQSGAGWLKRGLPMQ